MLGDYDVTGTVAIQKLNYLFLDCDVDPSVVAHLQIEGNALIEFILIVVYYERWYLILSH